MPAKLNLREIPDGLHAKARQAFDEGDALGMLILASSQCGMAIVFDNQHALLERGIYEDALVSAFTGCRSNHHRWSLSVIEYMFNLADRDKLRAAGEPFPDSGPLNVYRGVAGSQQKRKVRGFSWSRSLDQACWFANRFSLENPAVYVASLRADEVLCYSPDRGEQECIARPRRCRNFGLTTDEIKVAANRVKESRKVQNERVLAEFRESRPAMLSV